MPEETVSLPSQMLPSAQLALHFISARAQQTQLQLLKVLVLTCFINVAIRWRVESVYSGGG